MTIKLASMKKFGKAIKVAIIVACVFVIGSENDGTMPVSLYYLSNLFAALILAFMSYVGRKIHE